MPATSRPRRSALYMPASNPRAVEKARTLDCDVVILDLEDAVLPEAKEAARDAAFAAVRAGGFGSRELVVRVNALDTPWGAADLAALAQAPPDAVLAPKITGAADVAAYASAFPGTIWAMIETAPALFALDGIAGASPRLAALVMGLNDLAREMGARQTSERTPFFAALTLTVAAARTHGLAALDSVQNDIENLDSLAAACRQGADFGFDGKSLIHPSHLAIANEIFSPDSRELAWSRAVIAAFDAPDNVGKGALRVEGRLAERLHRDQAVRLVEIAERIEARR